MLVVGIGICVFIDSVRRFYTFCISTGVDVLLSVSLVLPQCATRYRQLLRNLKCCTEGMRGVDIEWLVVSEEPVNT